MHFSFICEHAFRTKDLMITLELSHYGPPCCTALVFWCFFFYFLYFPNNFFQIHFRYTCVIGKYAFKTKKSMMTHELFHYSTLVFKTLDFFFFFSFFLKLYFSNVVSFKSISDIPASFVSVPLGIKMQ